MGKSRNKSTTPTQPTQTITNMSPKQVDDYVDKIKSMSDNELMKAYSEFASNWTYVIEWNGGRRMSKFIRPSDDIIGENGILRGGKDNVNQQFVNLNRVRLELGAEMLNRNLDNEYGYSDVPYYEVVDGDIQFHPFTPTND